MSGISSRTHNVDCPHLDDQSLCRVTFTTVVKQPLIEWEPTYDGVGTMTNHDPNAFVSTYSCSVCLMNWESTETFGEAPVRRRLPDTVIT